MGSKNSLMQFSQFTIPSQGCQTFAVHLCLISNHWRISLKDFSPSREYLLQAHAILENRGKSYSHRWTSSPALSSKGNSFPHFPHLWMRDAMALNGVLSLTVSTFPDEVVSGEIWCFPQCKRFLAGNTVLPMETELADPLVKCECQKECQWVK